MNRTVSVKERVNKELAYEDFGHGPDFHITIGFRWGRGVGVCNIIVVINKVGELLFLLSV